MDIYEKLGVRKIINATGTVTRLGGCRMPREAFRAMAEAGRSFVNLDELHQKAGEYVARLLEVEAAYISSGASGGMVLAAAAYMAGSDPDRILALPRTQGLRNEIIVQNIGGHYVFQGMRHTGARLNSNPHSPIGRPMKVGKEDICGFVAALERFTSRDEDTELEEYRRRADVIVERLRDIPGIHAQSLPADPRARPVVPRVFIDLEPDYPHSREEVSRRMLKGRYPVAIGTTETGLKVDVMMLTNRQLRMVAGRLRDVLTPVSPRLSRH